MIDSAIEAGNYTLALKLIEKKMKEQPNSFHNIASKCYILTNAALSGTSNISIDDALNQSINLSKKTPSDPKTIKLLSATFDLLDHTPEEDLYESAMRKYQNTGLAFEWFKTTVEKNDLIGMQKAAMALSKAFKVETENGRMIKLWAAATMVLVVNCCQDGVRLSNGKDKLLVMLGLKIVEAVEGVSPQGLSAQEMFVKCQLLLRKGDNLQCIDELQKFLEKESDLELLLIYFEQLKENKMWELLYDATTNYLVNTGVDDWDTWKLAILAADKLNKTESMKKVINSYKVTRNSQLAKMQVLSTEGVEARSHALSSYLSLYMHKLCCFLDVKSFLDEDYIPKDTITSILETLVAQKVTNAVLDKKATNERELNILVNYVKIKARISPEIFKMDTFFIECCRYYNATKHLQNKLSEFDYYAGFEFVILAIKTYLTINKDAVDIQSFLNLIVLFEDCLIKNKYEFHLQLWLAHMYLNTNISAPLLRIFEALKIKNVQIDTLSPHFINHVSSRTRNNRLISESAKFYLQNVATEMPPMVMNCFEHQTFSKLQGFMEFKLRVENSITHYQLIVQNIQNLRLNDQKLALDTIVMDYVPILKNAYKLIAMNGQDIETKLHDNIDRKIMWDCGDHRVSDITAKIVNTEFSEIFDQAYVEINILKELLVYDQHARVWNDYKKRFLSLVGNTSNLSQFSEVEKEILKTLSALLDEDVTATVDFNPGKPLNPIEASFNHYYLSIQDFDRVLTTLNAQSSIMTFLGQKQQRSKLNELQKTVKKLIRDIDRDEIVLSAKAKLKECKEKSLNWFADDEFGKQFNVPVDVVNKCYKNFELDLMKAVREI